MYLKMEGRLGFKALLTAWSFEAKLMLWVRKGEGNQLSPFKRSISAFAWRELGKSQNLNLAGEKWI